MAEQTIKEQAEAFAALSESERAAAWPTLADDVKPLARELVTSRTRGFRHVNGRIEFSQGELANQIARLTEKAGEMDGRKAKVEERVAELRTEWAERGFDGTPEAYLAAQAANE